RLGCRAARLLQTARCPGVKTSPPRTGCTKKENASMKTWLALVIALVSSTASAQDQRDALSFVNEGTVNGPINEVWKVWSTSEGYKAVGVALADVDLRVGGLIRSRYAADGTLGDDQTIENEILAFEPPRMIAIRIHK